MSKDFRGANDLVIKKDSDVVDMLSVEMIE